MTTWLLRASAAATVAASSIAVQAQTAVAMAPARSAGVPLTLRQLFDAAWARQPEAMALQARRDAASSPN